MGNKSNAQKNLSAFGTSVKHFFVDTVYGNVKKAAQYVVSTVNKLVSTVHKDAVGLVKGVGSIVVHTEDALTGTVKSVSKDVKELGTNLGQDVATTTVGVSKNLSELGTPVMIAAGLGLAFVLLKK